MFQVVKHPESRARVYAQLAEVLPHLFRRLIVAMPDQVDGLARVTAEQFAVLSLLRDRGPLSMSELAIARKVALNTATTLVDRLVAATLVERSGHPGDRRIVKVDVTLKGRALVERLRAARRDAARRLLDELSDDEVDRVVAAMPALGRLAGLPASTASQP